MLSQCRFCEDSYLSTVPQVWDKISSTFDFSRFELIIIITRHASFLPLYLLFPPLFSFFLSSLSSSLLFLPLFSFFPFLSFFPLLSTYPFIYLSSLSSYSLLSNPLPSTPIFQRP